jgi:hypothetical protein
LICNIMAILFSGSYISKAQGSSVRIGIYDFVGNTAAEFYVLAPTVMFGYGVWKQSQLDLQLAAGFSFNQINYNGHHHYLYMVPLMATMYYHLPNPGAKVWPSFGMGIGLMGKADHNKDYDKSHNSLAYGYHATGRLNVSLKEDRLLTLDMTYNLMIPPVKEEVNISGVILTVGLKFPAKHNKNKK